MVFTKAFAGLFPDSFSFAPFYSLHQKGERVTLAGPYKAEADGVSSCVLPLLHIGAQESIDLGLIAWPLPPIPFEHIAIDADGELPFPRHRL